MQGSINPFILFVAGICFSLFFHYFSLLHPFHHKPTPNAPPTKISLPRLVGSFVDPSVWLFRISQNRCKTHIKTKTTPSKTKSKFALMTSFKEADDSSTGSPEPVKLVLLYPDSLVGSLEAYTVAAHDPQFPLILHTFQRLTFSCNLLTAHRTCDILFSSYQLKVRPV